MRGFETEILVQPEDLAFVVNASGTWVDTTHKRTPPSPGILDMDGSLAPTSGNRQDSAYKCYLACACYHPLFCFNQYGDMERTLLRNGNVHSADDWQSVLGPVIGRHRGYDVLPFFHGNTHIHATGARA